MQLLEEIVANAVSDEVKIAVILRKAMVLASRLGNKDLRDWANSELDGYGSEQTLPDYRSIRAMAKGDFAYIHALLRGHPIPAVLMHPEHRHWAETARLTQGVTAYEQLLASNLQGVVSIQWQQELVMLYADRFVEEANMMRAWQEIPSSALHELLDTVRNRLLQLALDLQSEMANVGIDRIAPEKVQQAVVSNIFHGNVVIASSISGGVRQVGKKTVVKGDFNSLAKSLKEAGVDTSAISDLEVAINQDKASGAPQGFGARVGGWLSARVESLGDGVAGAVVAQMVMSYFGLG